MKLDVDMLRYLFKDDLRVLTAVELDMRNVLKNLLKHKLLHHDSSKYDGFRLTYLGCDFLGIKTMVNKGVFVAVGRQIGVGKESVMGMYGLLDIFEVACEDGTVLAMKLHRLDRVSSRAVKLKRDYLRRCSSYNWLYLSRLAALKEFAFMKALKIHGFPVPDAIEHNIVCHVTCPRLPSFIEGGAESDTNSDSAGIDSVDDLNEADIKDGDFSHLLEQDQRHESQGKEESCETGESSGSEKEDASDKEENNQNATKMKLNS